MKKKILILVSLTLLCVVLYYSYTIDFHENPSYSQVSRLSDPCLSYSFTSPSKQLDDCINLISENRNITNHSLTRSNVEQILLFLVPKLMNSDYEPYTTSEGIILSSYANPYRFPNMINNIVPCDDVFCEREYNAFKNVQVSESVIYKFCLLFCTPSDTTSSGGIRAMENHETITPAESGENLTKPAHSTIVLAKPTLKEGIHHEKHPCALWKLLAVALFCITVVLFGIILLIIIILIWKCKFNRSTNVRVSYVDQQHNLL